MEIQVRTDRHLLVEDELVSFVGFELLAGLGPCAARVLSAHVHLSVETSVWKGPPALRCLLEVHPSGHAPLAVTRRADSKDAAIRAAVDDMRGVLERMFRRIDARPADETVANLA